MITGVGQSAQYGQEEWKRRDASLDLIAQSGLRDTKSVVLMTDHGSQEGSRGPLVRAVELLTGAPPLSIDARYFLSGGSGRVRSGPCRLQMEVPPLGLVVTPDVLIIYEIAPSDRGRFEAFQRHLPAQGPLSFSADPQAWRNATDKRLTVERFRRDGIPHMETIALRRPQLKTAYEAFTA